MGTSAIVEFGSGPEGNLLHSSFYKHYDGYPQGIGKFLKEFFVGMDGEGYEIDTWEQRVREELFEDGQDDVYDVEHDTVARWYYRLWKVGKDFYIMVQYNPGGRNVGRFPVVYQGKLADFEPKTEQEYFPELC